MTDVNVEDKVEVTRDADGYLVEQDTLTFTTPKDTAKEGATPGEELNIPFSYRQVDSEELAQKYFEEKGLSLLELVNRKLKGDARSNVYSTEANRHKVPTLNVPLEDVVDRMTKDLQRALKIPYDAARKMIEDTMAQNNG